MDFMLPALDVRMDTITASGISSGAYMASLMMLTDPQTFKGIGQLVGGTPLFDMNWMFDPSVERA